MYTEEVREFLQRKLLARMSVVDFDGYPHTVPVSFIMDGDDVIITTVRNTRKVHYIRRNSKGAVTIGGESSEGAGYLLKGKFSLEEDPGLEWLKRTEKSVTMEKASERSALSPSFRRRI